MASDFDLVIIGGGCAGLSLASRLAKQPRRLRVLVLEARDTYRNDRTWCFWAPASNPYDKLVAKAWKTWRFSASGETPVKQSEKGMHYQCLPALVFYEAAIERISRSPCIELHTSVEVGMVSSHGGCALVDTDRGSVSTRWVIDTRPPPLRSDGGFAQVFTGIEIETDGEAFDPSCVGLMQDMSSDDDGFRFTYLLPFSSRHALIEETRFTAAVDEGRLQNKLRLSVEQITGGLSYRVLRRERGRIPMQVSAGEPQRQGQVWHAGTGGGAVRPSTGYAFLRIQRWADACDVQLAQGMPPAVHPRDPAWRRAADALFLQVIEKRPSLAPDLFLAMARGVDAGTLVRFLSDEGSLLDFVQVAAALPKSPFLTGLVVSKWLQATA